MKTFRGPEASWWQADRRETVCLADRELFLMLQQEPRVPPFSASSLGPRWVGLVLTGLNRLRKPSSPYQLDFGGDGQPFWDPAAGARTSSRTARIRGCQPSPGKETSRLQATLPWGPLSTAGVWVLVDQNVLMWGSHLGRRSNASSVAVLLHSSAGL